MTLEEHLAAYGETVAGQPFAIDAKGVCELAFAQGVRVVVEPVPGEAQAQLWAVLGRLPPAHAREALLTKLLEGNLFGLATGGATLALDRAREEILLCRGFVPEALDAAGFAALLEGFADMAALWTREAAQPVDGPVPDGRMDLPSFGQMIRG